MKPIELILTCPLCGARHIDEGEFATKPHHTHACQSCGLPWRPAIVNTVGVRFLPGFRDAVEADPVETNYAKGDAIEFRCPTTLAWFPATALRMIDIGGGPGVLGQLLRNGALHFWRENSEIARPLSDVRRRRT